MQKQRVDINLAVNSVPRIPVCLCLDTSGSMLGIAIKNLNAGIKLLFDTIKNDNLTSAAAEVAIIVFGSGRHNGIECIQDFERITDISEPPFLKAEGMTPMGEAVALALNRFEDRKIYYRSKGLEYYSPLLIIMTDGYPNGNSVVLQKVQNQVKTMVSKRELNVVTVCIGKDADENSLQRFSPEWKPIKLEKLDFKGFFKWVSKSVESILQNRGEFIVCGK